MSVAYAVDGLWTVIATIGVGVSSWALVDGYFDRRSREMRGSNGIEKSMIRMNARSAYASLYLHSFFLILGALAFARPTAAEFSPSYILLVAGYIFVAATNVRSVGLNQLARLRLRQGNLPT